MVKAYDAAMKDVEDSVIANEVVNAVTLDQDLAGALVDSRGVHFHSAQSMGAPIPFSVLRQHGLPFGTAWSILAATYPAALHFSD